MHRVDEQGGRPGRLRLAILALIAAATALALALPAFASADPVSLEVEKEGSGGGTVTSVPAGISCGAGCEAEFEEGEEVTLSASADAESEFAEWEGCDSEPSGNCKVTMDEPRAVTAVFEEIEPPEYSLEINEAGNGEGEWECLVGGEEEYEFCEEEYPQGTHVTIKAIPYENSKFSGFGDDCAGKTGKLCSLVMDRDHAVTLTFSLVEFTLTVKKIGGTSSGGVECEREEGPEPCKTKYPWGTEVVVLAVPASGYEFLQWEDCDKEPETGACEVEMEEARAVTVTFGKAASIPEYTLKVKEAGTGTGTVTSSPSGISCGATCEAKFEEGKEVTLTATPTGSSTFAGWSGSGCSGTGTCKVTMSAAKEVTATFNPPATPEFNLTITKNGTGTGTVKCKVNGGAATTCATKYTQGTGIELVQSADAGSEFAGWSGGSCAGTGSCSVTINADTTVTATFNSKPSPEYTLTVQREGDGSGSVASDPAGIECGDDCTENYREGTVVTLTATPVSGSVFKRWSGVEGGCALEPVCRTKMGASKVVKAMFDSPDQVPVVAPKGRAKVVKRVALVRGGRALLDLRCAGGPCRGGLELTARLKKGKKSLLIGRRSFNLAPGARNTVQVRLSGSARREVARRGKLIVKVKGGGVLGSIVKLRNATKKKR